MGTVSALAEQIARVMSQLVGDGNALEMLMYQLAKGNSNTPAQRKVPDEAELSLPRVRLSASSLGGLTTNGRRLTDDRRLTAL